MKHSMDLTESAEILAGRFGRAALLSLKDRLTAHAHAQTHLIIKLGGPDQVFVVDGQTVPLTADRAVVVNPWQEHHYTPTDTAAISSYLALYLNPGWLRRASDLFDGCGLPGFFERPSIRVDERAQGLARELRDLIHALEGRNERAEDVIVALMTHFVRAENAGRTTAQGFVDYRIRRAVEQMQDNPDRQYDLDALARSVGLSRSRFNVLFKDTVGVGPGIYGNAIRIEAAVSALADRASAQDVAADLGFSSPGNFNRFFRYHTGVSPAKFKRALQDIG